MPKRNLLQLAIKYHEESMVGFFSKKIEGDDLVTHIFEEKDLKITTMELLLCCGRSKARTRLFCS